jgi:hypothetical protein
MGKTRPRGRALDWDEGVVGGDQPLELSPAACRATCAQSICRYLYYAAMTDCIRLDYDFLFAVGNMRVAETMAPLSAYTGLDRLVVNSERIGYSASTMRASLHIILPRLAMHTGIRSFDDLRQLHLDEMIDGVEAFAARSDTHLFRNEEEDFPTGFGSISCSRSGLSRAASTRMSAVCTTRLRLR